MRAVFFCLFTFSFLLSSACRPAAPPVSVSNTPVSINDRPTTNLPMPPSKSMEEMSWKKVGGGQERLKSLQGKAVILDFWATFCPPCVEEIPHLNSLQAKYGVENLQIVGLNVGGEDDRPLIADFAAKLKIAYPIAIPDDELSRFIFATRDDIPQT